MNVRTSIVARADSLGPVRRTVGDRIVHDHIRIQERGPLDIRVTEPGHASARDGKCVGVPRKPTSHESHNA